ncbi:metal-dependent phosphohydrolase [Herbidospora galbida]|uniref:Metal-dependent phosphohydrolase n=1 Tax=Herbidospora galbida TaxID=2575442 RepID=A0A4V5UZY6_9ACTN|nr:metal-dependent phosphohydrolase [Herbidospora galbida]TKK84803.1 metal-dependent phosphohydrolase [Herbidospora galbida]
MTQDFPHSPAGRALVAELSARWAEPHRRYHTTRHLTEVLAAVDTLQDHAHDVRAVRLAAWFHDAVYDGRPGLDEERSAQLAQSRLAALRPPFGREVAHEVARLVRVTATHAYEEGDANAAVLCDADLAVLGQPSGDYDVYARAIRQEYRHVPDPLFRVGRAEVLRRLLDSPLYGTRMARDLWEDQARHNLARELRHITD